MPSRIHHCGKTWKPIFAYFSAAARLRDFVAVWAMASTPFVASETPRVTVKRQRREVEEELLGLILDKAVELFA